MEVRYLKRKIEGKDYWYAFAADAIGIGISKENAYISWKMALQRQAKKLNARKVKRK